MTSRAADQQKVGSQCSDSCYVDIHAYMTLKLTEVEYFPDGIADTPCCWDDIEEGRVITRWLPEQQNQQQAGVEHKTDCCDK